MDPNGISMLLALHTTPFHKNGEAETTVQRFHADDSPPQFKKGSRGNGRGVRGQWTGWFAQSWSYERLSLK